GVLVGHGMDAMSRTDGDADGRRDQPPTRRRVCPAADGDGHEVEFIFAFAEEENEGVGGLYAEGDVVHAYAHCGCGASYSHKWLVDSRR
ncbi:MAG: hypothetical protein J07HB67_01881, partial [halophilic archaeon J07HB67]